MDSNNGESSSASSASSFGNIGSIETYFRLKFVGAEAIIAWCMSHGLIASGYTCPKCNSPMKLAPRRDLDDQFSWVCRVGEENPHHVKRSIRKGSWFEESKLPMIQILLFLCMWCGKISTKMMKEWLKMSSTTAADWASYYREVCQEILLRDSGKIGGPGTVVEIDESKFGKRKYHRGKRVEGKWVFGGLERGSGKCFFSAVQNRGTEVLLSIIKERILPGTTVMSDCWKSYDCLSHEGFIHLTVNHSLTFKDPDTGAHTNGIEGSWSAIKRSFRGTRRVSDQFDSYLAEYMWRKRNRTNCERMQSMLDALKILYPPKSCDDIQ